MWPSFGTIFGEPIPAYFTLLMVGFGAATFIAARMAKRAELDHDVIVDLSLLSLLSGVAGGRLLHVLADGYFWDYVHLCTDPDKVIWRVVTSAAECAQLGGRWDPAGTCHAVTRDCFAWAAFWNGGLAYYGGLFTATATGILFLRRERFPLGKGVDMVGAVLPLGLFFGRLGCFFGGCCFGVTTDRPLGMVFPGGSPASLEHFQAGLLPSKHLASLAVHPTQLYEALGCLLLAFYLVAVALPRKRFDGQVLLLFLGLYAVLRFGIEYLRADERGEWFGLSTSQWLSLLILGACGLAWPVLAKRAQQAQRAAANVLGPLPTAPPRC